MLIKASTQVPRISYPQTFYKKMVIYVFFENDIQFSTSRIEKYLGNVRLHHAKRFE